MNGKSKQEIENAISQVMTKFLKEQMGEEAEAVITQVVGDTIIVRFKGVLPPAERHLAKNQEGKRLIREMKEKLSESNTEQAQGGIAVVLSEGDSFERHFEDALRVGSGLCKDNNLDYSPVRLLAQMNIFDFLTPPLGKIFLKGYNA